MKLHYAILILLWLNSCALFPQDTMIVQKHQLDSIRLLIKSKPRADTARVKLLFEYAELCFSDRDFHNGLIAANEARLISAEINYPLGEGLFLESMAFFHESLRTPNKFINLDVFYRLQANRMLNQYTNFDIFGQVIVDHDGRDLEIDQIIANLQMALVHFQSQGYSEIAANIHYALAGIYYGLEGNKSDEHKKLAKNLFHELGLSYNELAIVLFELVKYWERGREDTTRILEIEAITIYTAETQERFKAYAACLLGRIYAFHGRTTLGFEYLFAAEAYLTDLDEKDLLKSVYLTIAATYEWYLRDSERAWEYEKKEMNLRRDIGYWEGIEYTYALFFESSLSLNRMDEFPDEYMDYLQVGRSEEASWFDAEVLWTKGRLSQSEGRSREAQILFSESITVYQEIDDKIGAIWPALDLSESYRSTSDVESALKYASLAFKWSSEVNLFALQFRAADLLSQLFEDSGDNGKAFDFLKQYKSLKYKSEQLSNATQISELEIQAILNQKQREILALETEKKVREQQSRIQRIWIFSITGALFSLILITFLLVRNNRQRRRTYSALASTLEDLKATQSQLIQSEKMASLGELTAGIAHEIQNPLNFVNNFSELNEELIGELKDVLKKGNLEEAVNLAEDLFQNEEKIKQHGKRAEGIVKSMLQHSRINSGQKEPTDINALCDEYLRLAYHGFRAKDKSFNATYKLDLDPALPKVNVVPQDIGRVLLNLINNAFHACTERSRSAVNNLSDLAEPKSVENLTDLQETDFKPLVSVTTQFNPPPGGRGAGASPLRGTEGVTITISDNGPGIPDTIRDKIFQPFFTTKSTGQGTGLGLSLSYDIVHAHGGEIVVESKEGSGTEFIVRLPFV